MPAADQDLTSRPYWDAVWNGRAVPAPMNPYLPGLNGTFSRKLHETFREVFTSIGARPGSSIIEIGCGGSTILPYFTQTFGFITSGLDVSMVGCEFARAIATRVGLPSDIVEGDVFAPVDAHRDAFDIVFSNGVAEHFTPTARIIRAIAAYARPGGHVVTFVPNMRGMLGVIQRHVNRPVYDLHVPLAPRDLARAHADCGLTVIDARCIISANFSILNFEGGGSRVPARIGLRLASWTSKAIWLAERYGLTLPANRLTSPYILVVARKN